MLEALKAIVLSPAQSAAVENIYQKRHIAAGIPSIYGNYTEPKFDALGLSFRVEHLVGRLLDDLVSEGIEPYVTRDSLRRMAKAIERFERALAVDGVDSRALTANLRMLEASFHSHNFTFHQYQNVFQFLVNSVTELSAQLDTQPRPGAAHASSRTTPASARRDACPSTPSPRWCSARCWCRLSACRPSTATWRPTLRQISMLNGRLSSQALTRMMNYDPERLVSPIHEPKPSTDDQMTLGFKGLGLKQMASYGHQVPEGFILTTELFSAMPAMSYRPFYDDTMQRIRKALDQLEKDTGLRLGDPTRSLLLSIRSGAAISMPGLMTTFVNVGLNDELAEALSRKPGFEWAAWDGYRRLLQSWAMSAGIDRDFFDAIMTEFKGRYGVERKLDFTPEHMREIAFTYKERARERGVVFVEDPFRQVVACVLQGAAVLGFARTPSSTGSTSAWRRSGGRRWWYSGWCSAT